MLLQLLLKLLFLLLFLFLLLLLLLQLLLLLFLLLLLQLLMLFLRLLLQLLMVMLQLLLLLLPLLLLLRTYFVAVATAVVATIAAYALEKWYFRTALATGFFLFLRISFSPSEGELFPVEDCEPGDVRRDGELFVEGPGQRKHGGSVEILAGGDQPEQGRDLLHFDK